MSFTFLSYIYLNTNIKHIQPESKIINFGLKSDKTYLSFLQRGLPQTTTTGSMTCTEIQNEMTSINFRKYKISITVNSKFSFKTVCYKQAAPCGSKDLVVVAVVLKKVIIIAYFGPPEFSKI